MKLRHRLYQYYNPDLVQKTLPAQPWENTGEPARHPKKAQKKLELSREEKVLAILQELLGTKAGCDVWSEKTEELFLVKEKKITGTILRKMAEVIKEIDPKHVECEHTATLIKKCKRVRTATCKVKPLKSPKPLPAGEIPQNPL